MDEFLNGRVKETVCMTEEQFQKKYHDYFSTSSQEAETEAAKVNEIAIGFEVSAVSLLGKYCLMLNSVADEVDSWYKEGVEWNK